MTITSIANKHEWNSVLQEQFSSSNSICYRYEYFDLYQKYFSTTAETLFWEDENVKIFWPHLVRDIDSIEYFKHCKYSDVTVPYCFYGPLIVLKKESETYPESIAKFITLYQEYAKKNRYVSEFVRFHPILENWRFFNQCCDLVHVNDMVIVDLRENESAIWNGMHKNTRWEISKAEKEFDDITITEKPEDEDLHTFHLLYTKTMERNKAEKKYFFSYEFIRDHFTSADGVLVCCKNKRGIIGTSTIFLKDSKVLHAYLSGNNSEFTKNNLLFGEDYKFSTQRFVLWEAIKWAKAHNLTHVHLGGWKVKNDTIFQFKASISKNIRPLFIGQLIFDKTVYDGLVSKNPLLNGNEDYFPLYRKNIGSSVV